MYDVIVLGGGPGGYVAAIKASQLGKKVALIEDVRLGGTCLNRGCIPTKALYRSSYVGKLIKNADEFGFDIEGFSINYNKIKDRKDKIVENLVKGIEALVDANKIHLFQAKGIVLDSKTIKLEGLGKEIQGEKIIIATGSKAFVPPILGSDLPNVITSDEILELEELPKKLTIIGGGVVGTEFAGIFAQLGVEVTLIEMLPRILYYFDEELVKRLNVYLKKIGVKILTGAKVNKIEENHAGLNIDVQTKKGNVNIDTDICLMAGGRTPNLTGIENLSLQLKDSGGILTNNKMETNIDNIYAIGDCTGGMMLAHVASAEGIVAAENIAGKESQMDYSSVPSVVFTFPELSSVGLTKEQCQAEGIEHTISKFNFAANGKALAEGEPEGIVKVIAAKDNTLLGVHILGPHSSDLIAEATLAVQNKLKASDLYKTIHAHPTLAETLMEAATGIDGSIIHQAPKEKR